MKIKTKIQLIGLPTVFIVLIISIFGIYFFATINIKSSINEGIQLMADTRADEVKIYLDGLQGRIYDFSIDERLSSCLANVTGVSSGTCTAQEVSEKILNNKLISLGELNEIYFINNDQKILASTKEGAIGQVMTSQTSYIKGTQQTYVSEIFYLDEVNNTIALNIAAPIKFSGQDIGYLVAVVELTKLEKILLNENGLGETGDIYLVNQKGIIQTPSRFDEHTTLQQTINNENYRTCIDDMNKYLNDQGEVEEHYETVPEYITFSGEKVVGAHAYIENQGWCLMAETKKQEISSTLTPVLNYMIIMGVVILLVFMLISNKIGKTITNPLNKLKQEVDHVADGFYKHKFKNSEYEEYDKLSKSIDRLAEIIDKLRKK